MQLELTYWVYMNAVVMSASASHWLQPQCDAAIPVTLDMVLLSRPYTRHANEQLAQSSNQFPWIAVHQARARQACQQQCTHVRGLIVPWHQPG